MQLVFREVNRNTFEAIRDGKKKIETRAGGKGYEEIRKGDYIELVCGDDKFLRKVAEVEKFFNVAGLLAKYGPEEINPACSSAEEIERIYLSFPDYCERVKKYGLIAFQLE